MHIIFRLLGLAVLVTGSNAFAVPPTKNEFPRLGGVQIGQMPYPDRWNDAQYQRDLAKLDLIILGGAAPNSMVDQIKQRNPDATVIKYTILVHASSESQQSYKVKQRDKLNSESGPNNSNAYDWWLRDIAGNRIRFSPGTYETNFLEYVRPDNSGERFPEFKARLNHEFYFKDTEYDGVYSDSVFLAPRWSKFDSKPDYSGGNESSRLNIEAAYRRGHLAYWSKTSQLSPNILRMVNGDWYRFADSDAWRPPDYDQKVHGGLMEKIMKESDLDNAKSNPWSRVMVRYNRYIQYFLDPKLLMFVVQGVPDNYRFFRYSFATCLMNNGFFDFVPIGDFQYGTVEWFDEFDLAGTATTRWLGNALTPPPSSDWQHGVYRRDFEGGIALVNPMGNGTQTVIVEEGFVRITGRQDPEINNGRRVDRLTISEGDGIVLERIDKGNAELARPRSPQLVIE